MFESDSQTDRLLLAIKVNQWLDRGKWATGGASLYSSEAVTWLRLSQCHNGLNIHLLASDTGLSNEGGLTCSRGLGWGFYHYFIWSGDQDHPRGY